MAKSPANTDRPQRGGASDPPLEVGRRNSLFIGSPEAGKRAAILYTLERECQRVKVDIEAWLPDYRVDYNDLLQGMQELQEQGSRPRPPKPDPPI